MLLGVTGGIAAFKSVLLLRRLQDAGCEVRVVQSKAATRFVGEATFHALSGHPVYRSVWDLQRSEGGELHVELSRWADAIVVYPATSHFVGGLAAGLCDDLLGLTIQCFEGPVLVCPAMHHRMANNPLHMQARDRLVAAGVHILPPVEGRLASGEFGSGRLPEPDEALAALQALLGPQDLGNRSVLVSAGPTREALDPVRFLSNGSTGRMGFALAAAAARRGAAVTLVSGPCSLATPAGVERVDVVSAQEMAEAIDDRFADSDAVIMAAAVADYRPAHCADHKLKKQEGMEGIPLEPTPDILAGLGQRKKHQILIGFAMETKDLLAGARAKLEAKNLDLIAANNLAVDGAGFGGKTNVVTLLDRTGNKEELPLQSKDAVAERILDRLAALLS